MSKKTRIKIPLQKSTVAYTTDITTRNTGLDSLRGIFAIMVYCSHLELMKYYAGLEHMMGNDIVFQLGRIGVTGFFVLSGFLITLHLLQLKDKDGSAGKKINTFYLKRVLRIWPLYYTIILLSLYVFPHIHALNFKLPHEATDARLDLSRFQYYYLFLIPQVPLSSSIVLPYAEPSWSVGVEEIFYLFIPLVIFSTKRLQTVLIGLCALFIIFRAVSFASSTSPYEDPLTSFLIFSKYDCICIGCLAGVYFHRQRNFIEYIKKYIFTIAVIVLFLLTVTISRFAYQYIHFALLFAVIILYIARNPNNFLNNKLLQFYGKISFSLYMTHEIAIMLLLNKFDFSEYPPALLYLTGFLTATLLAFITYKIVEEPFLKIKNKIRLEDKSLTIPA